MKHLTGILIVLFTIGFVACQKELGPEIFTQPPTDTTPIPGGNGMLRARINGVQWEANKEILALVTLDTSTGLFELEFSGDATDDEGIIITLRNFKTGTHQLLTTSGNLLEYVDSLGNEWATGNAPAGSSPGSVIITSIDSVNKRFSGTFSCTAYSSDSTSRTFTNGEFTNIPYIKIAGPPPASPTDTFNVRINNAIFNPYSIITATVVGQASGIFTTDSLESKSVVLYFPFSLPPGNHIMDTALNLSYYRSGTDTFRMRRSNPGLVQVLQNDTVNKRIRGNFSFTGYKRTNPNDSARLTQGYFSVEYP